MLSVRARIRTWSFIVIAAATAACASIPGSGPAATGGTPGTASVTFVHLNDMHEMVAGSSGRLGGVSRVATVVERERRAREAVLVTLGGDYLSPSAIATARVDGQRLAGRQAVAVLNLLGVNWATFGNHEFDLSEQEFQARLAETRFGLVSTNVTDAGGRVFAPAVRSAVQTVKAGSRTLRIGFLGLTIDFTIKPYVKYLPAVQAARDAMAGLRGKVDAIVVLSHLGLAGEIAVAEALPEVDLILGGHEHDNFVIRRGAGFTPILKADSNAKSVVIATMDFPAAGRPSVTARVEQLNESVRPQPMMEAEVSRWASLAFAAFRRDGFEPTSVVAVVNEPLDGRDSTVRVRAGNLTDLITAAMARDAKDAEIAILNGGSIRVDDILPAGPLSEYDVIRVLPFGGTVVKSTWRGSLLIDVLAAGLANQGAGGFLHARGLERQGGDWRFRGQPIDPNRRYVVAVPEYLLTGGESRMGFLTRTNPLVENVQDLSDIRQAVIAELKARYGGTRSPSTVRSGGLMVVGR